MQAAVFWGVTTLFAAVSFLMPFIRSEASLLTWIAEEAYRFGTIARHFVQDGILSFDGFSETNAIAPVWLAFLSFCLWLLPDSVMTLPALLQVFGLVCTLVSVRLLAVLLSRMGVGHFFPLAAASTVFLFLYVVLAQTGMPAMLAVPLLFFSAILLDDLLATPAGKKAFLTGLCASCLVLTCVDAGLFLLVAVWLLYKKNTQTGFIKEKHFFHPSVLAGLIWGLLPLFFYVAWLKMQTGSFLPTDILIRFSRQAFAVNTEILGQLFWHPWTSFFSMSLNVLTIFLPAVIVFFAGFSALFRLRDAAKTEMLLYLSFVLFALFYFALYIFWGGWLLSRWHLYPLVAALPLCTAHTAKLVEEKLEGKESFVLYRSCAAIAFLALFVLGAGIAAKKDFFKLENLDRAAMIADFMHEFPGRYAVGETAAMTAWLAPEESSVLPLNGLSLPVDHLAFLTEKEPLLVVAESYDADYLAITGAEEDDDCFFVKEPSDRFVGSYALHLSDWVCQNPFFHFKTADGRLTHIFKLN